MRNMLKAERYKFFHSYALWVVIGVLFAFCCISIMTGIYGSAENALLNISKDTVVPLLGCSVYSAIILLDDFSNGLLQHYIASGYERTSIICAKFIHYIFGCSVLLLVYPFLCVSFTAIVRGVETSLTFVLWEIILVFIKSLPLYLGIAGLFFLVSILLQNAAITIAVSVAASIFLGVFPNRLYAGNLYILKYSPMIQLNEVAVDPISGEYLIAIIISLFLLGLYLCGSIAKFKQDQYRFITSM